MTRALRVLALFAASGLASLFAPARAAAASAFALPLLARGEAPDLLLAQRVIDRSWGPSEDSVYVELDVPEWRSEGAAFGLSAMVPGAGQIYAGERRGLWFALAEVVGWSARFIYRRRGDELRDDAERYAGAPNDSSAAWSMARWTAATQSDPAELRRLYAADPEVFYDLIASDPRYAAGWNGAESRDFFGELREISDARFRNARYATIALWVNHLTAAVDALRAARLHNRALAPKLGFKVKSGWQSGSPRLTAVLERRF